MNRSEKHVLLFREWHWLMKKRKAMLPKNRKPYKRKHLDRIDRAIEIVNAHLRLNHKLILTSDRMTPKRPVWGN